jgi:phosphoribosyl-dephospho-CoA transferase
MIACFAARVHDLLRLGSPGQLQWDAEPPAWAASSLERAPWVVVRRPASREHCVAVGVRGGGRAHRAAAWLHPRHVLSHVRAEDLAAAGAWRSLPHAKAMPVFLALDRAQDILDGHGFAGQWGVGGSIGFELASGVPTASNASDLDLHIRAQDPVSREVAKSLDRALASLAVRCDVLFETPRGAVALAEFAHANGRLRLRTAQGSRLVTDPWEEHMLASN